MNSTIHMILNCFFAFIFLGLLPSLVYAFEIPPEIKEFPSSEYLLHYSQNEDNQRMEILGQYQKWHGTRYRFGGNTQKGIDCSALMQQIFWDMRNLRLPRTTSEQISKGFMIERKKLKAGDLVFFLSGPSQRHVGVYIGSGEFMHASTSEGVTISYLNNKFWNTRFLTARRIIY